MVLLMVVTVAYMPLVLSLLLEGVSVDPVKIARSLVFLMLVPLAIGLLVKARLSGVAASTQPLLNKLSTLSLAVLILLLLITNAQNVVNKFWDARHFGQHPLHRRGVWRRMDAWWARF